MGILRQLTEDAARREIEAMERDARLAFISPASTVPNRRPGISCSRKL